MAHSDDFRGPAIMRARVSCLFHPVGHSLAKAVYRKDKSGRRVARCGAALCDGNNIGHEDPLK